MKKKRKVNLNSLIEDSDERKRQKIVGTTRVFFDGGSIVAALCRKIRQKDTCFVMGCSCWFTNKKIIGAMAKNLKGCCMIVTKDKITKAETTKKKYRTLPIYSESAVRVIGHGSGYTKSLMHHKFLVGLNEAGDALWVSNGSFNMTEGATSHLENCMIISDPLIANVFLDVFVNIFKISRPLVV